MTELSELEKLARAAREHLACATIKADNFGLQIWGKSQKGGDTHIIDIRGWGYLTGGGHGALGLSEADGIAAQKAVQAYAVAAWNAVPALIAERDALRAGLEEIANGLPEVRAAHRFSAARDLARQLLTPTSDNLMGGEK